MQDIIKEVDRLYEPYLKPANTDPYHRVMEEFVLRCREINKCRVLEIGSREVSVESHRIYFQPPMTYVGFDVHAGPNVDVSGDAHELSNYFEPSSFDAVFSLATFEHFVFPWKVVLEINKILRIGGICHVSTVNVWPPHELPWDFWRYLLSGLKLLFTEATGFKIISAAEGLPARVHSLSDGPATRGISAVGVSLGVALIAEKINDYDHDKLRWDIPLKSVTDSIYPVDEIPRHLRKLDDKKY